jgi:hypothetical protein
VEVVVTWGRSLELTGGNATGLGGDGFVHLLEAFRVPRVRMVTRRVGGSFGGVRRLGRRGGARSRACGVAGWPRGHVQGQKAPLAAARRV